MLYLLDANVLIDANRDYYPIDRVPEFWDWLSHLGNRGDVRIPREIFDEITAGKKDELTKWAQANAELILPEEPDPPAVNQVVCDGYAPDLSDEDLEKLGHDPFMIAYALYPAGSRCVVTTEVSRPSKQRGNRKVPDVCQGLGVKCLSTFQFVRELDFRTRWR